MKPKTSDRLTINELSETAGVKESTIRMYQHRGLMHGPMLEGRVGYYGQLHLQRLRLIGRLQDEGYSLAGIGRLVQAWDSGRGLVDLLSKEEPVTVSRVEFESLFPRLAEEEDLLERLETLGALSRSERDLVLADDRLLRIGAALADTGIGLEAVVSEAEHTARSTEDLAVRFVQLFEQQIWKPFVEAGMPPDELPEILEQLNQLQPLAVEAVAASMRNALQKASAEAIERVMDGTL